MGVVRSARAHWVRRHIIAWNGPVGPGITHRLNNIALTRDPQGLPEEVRARFPHLRSYQSLLLPPDAITQMPEILRGEIVISAWRDHALLDVTGAQIPGVLDDLYFYDGPLGIEWSAGVPTLRVWAPTARSLRLVFSDGESIGMLFDQARGVWSARGNDGWRDRMFRYEVEVFTRVTGRIEKNLATDPYSLNVSANSEWSQIVDLEDPRWKPAGWDSLNKPKFARVEDAVLYELHVRDFSMMDPAVPPEIRGTYLAFAQPESFGMRHLLSLAQAGLTHVHLLPVFDFATVNENRGAHRDPGDLSYFPPDSPEQQKAVTRFKEVDGFNWGYDPVHYFAPEGSYALDPNSGLRILHFRTMVQALAQAGLRVVMDVVFNHTHGSGPNDFSVLDRIVPGYYHRLNAEGEVETSSCCPNTASEHAMMEKLMLDSVTTWASAYKIDGFRFDLMGHHMKSNMLKVRAALPDSFIYGEGWDFGEVAHNARGINATQRNLAGAGIGTFNDRLRDAVRGGGAFRGIQEPGFATGLADDPDHGVRIGLAGSLEGLGGFRHAPRESVNYAAAHDNETLFDAVHLKAPRDASMTERVRMNNLAVSVVMLAQGIPFFHAGDELLRSKSFDRNSFNSGDWFNRLNYTLQTNHFGAGLPPAWENEKNWAIHRPLLADPALRPAPSHIARAVEHFREMLTIRKSSPLFRLPDRDAVVRCLRFLPSDRGTILLLLRDENETILVAFNAHRIEKAILVSDLTATNVSLHPVLQNSGDTEVRRARIDGAVLLPPLTTAVFIKR